MKLMILIFLTPREVLRMSEKTTAASDLVSGVNRQTLITAPYLADALQEIVQRMMPQKFAMNLKYFLNEGKIRWQHVAVAKGTSQLISNNK